MSLTFDKPCKFDFSVELYPDGHIRTRYTCTPISALLFPATFNRVSDIAFYLSNQISHDFINLGIRPQNKEDLKCK